MEWVGLHFAKVRILNMMISRIFPVYGSFSKDWGKPFSHPNASKTSGNGGASVRACGRKVHSNASSKRTVHLQVWDYSGSLWQVGKLFEIFSWPLWQHDCLVCGGSAYGPAFLEAALISQFGSFLFAFCCSASCWTVMMHFSIEISVQLFCHFVAAFTCAHVGPSTHWTLWKWGIRGCKNERSGGETMRHEVDLILHTWFTSLTSVLACRSEVQLGFSA